MGGTRLVPFAAFAAEVLRLYQPPARRPATRAKLRQVLAEFAALCTDAGSVSPLAVADWLAAHADRRPMTNYTLLSSFRAACRYGVYRGYMADPFAFRPLRAWFPADELEPGDDEFPRHRSAAEIAAVLRQADEEAQDGRWEALRLRAAV